MKYTNSFKIINTTPNNIMIKIQDLQFFLPLGYITLRLYNKKTVFKNT